VTGTHRYWFGDFSMSGLPKPGNRSPKISNRKS